MADTFAIVYGSTTIDINDTTNYKIHDNTFNVNLAMPAIVEHQPQSAPPTLLEMAGQSTTVSFKMSVFGGSRDLVLAKISRLKRLIDGAFQVAAQYELTNANSTPVYFKIKRDGATYATLHRVRYGNINDGGAHWDYVTESSSSKLCRQAVVTLVIEDAGICDTTMRLKNYMTAGGDSFTLFSSGIAMGWGQIGFATYSQETTYYLLNKSCQKVVTDTTNEQGVWNGVTPITCTTTDAVCGFVWIAGTGDPITLRLVTGASTTISEKTFTPSSPTGYDQSVTANGLTWYRYSFSDDGDPARGSADVAFRILRRNTDATQITTFYLDCAYITVGTATAPDGWSSRYQLYNKGDYSSSNPNNINHLDVGLLPGDMPALLLTKITPESSEGGTRVVASRYTDTLHAAVDYPAFLDSGTVSSTTASSGSWSSVADTDAGNNTSYQFTASADGASGTLIWGTTIVGDTAYRLFARPFAVILRVKSNSSAAQGYVTITDQFLRTYSYSSSINYSDIANSTYWLVFVDTINATNVIPASRPDTSQPTILITVGVKNIANTKTVNVDGLWFFPQDGEYMITGKGLVNDNVVWFDPNLRANPVAGGVVAQTQQGTLYNVMPGVVTNRLNILLYEKTGSSEMDQNAYFDTELTVTPRARFLIGGL